MNTKVWRITGLVMAMMGAMTLAQAEPGEGEGRPKDGKKGKGGRPSHEEMLQKFDKDGDGELSEAERTVMREQMAERRGGQGGPGGERPDREEMLKKFDKDGDGELNDEERAALREEMGDRKGGRRGPDRERPSREEMLKKYDKDGDGELNEEERAALRKDMGDRKGKGKGGPGGGGPQGE